MASDLLPARKPSLSSVATGGLRTGGPKGGRSHPIAWAVGGINYWLQRGVGLFGVKGQNILLRPCIGRSFIHWEVWQELLLKEGSDVTA